VKNYVEQLSPNACRRSLENLIATLYGHPAVDNNFYRLWMSQPLRIQGLEVFVRNYGAFIISFPNAMAAIIKGTSDLEAKTEHVKTLFSEMGYGNPQKLHSVLFDNFFSEIAKKLGHEGRLERKRLERDLELLPTTHQFIDGEMALYGNEDPRIAVGAQLAQEWQAYTMLRQLYEGARKYMPLWENQDEFHEACEYYYVHIGAAEKDHKEESLAAAMKVMGDEEDLEQVAEGFNMHLGIYVDFWEGIYKAIMATEALRAGV